MMRTHLNAFVLPEEEALLAGSVSDASTHSRRLQAYCCNFAAQSRGNVVLLNLSLGVFCSADGTLTSGSLRLRSPSKVLAQSISSYLSSTLVL
ncbi:Coatomer beta subunit [Giardia duodenalis]|uniref:Coatomer beta subunit n=1 Tax=Giardia intestinalis TaxID=5741 RepID=V6TNK2_GIAIN|nr:Coatomer beta subunit [Giardia intestinalis]